MYNLLSCVSCCCLIRNLTYVVIAVKLGLRHYICALYELLGLKFEIVKTMFVHVPFSQIF